MTNQQDPNLSIEKIREVLIEAKERNNERI